MYIVPKEFRKATHSDAMRHLSLTGPSAGMRFCNVKSGDAWHAVYLTDNQWRTLDLCIDCVHEWAILDDIDWQDRKENPGVFGD